MILSHFTLQGFKSFAKKVELSFDGRITAVVGPNGCGKTNIVDAIRWGLGEQRPSILRTDRMENVIFGGAHSSRPLGMAEASITFDNSQHILPIDYNEVVITRRLYRSGESEYLINKTPVRLKDIHDILMDTGIGADAYSVIELKMVEDILSDKVEDRRKLLEEAAGVTKYKYRLKAAIRKLDSTQNDLTRVQDIILEVERNVNSLKRQEQRARRYQTLQEELKVLELCRGKQLLERLDSRLKPLKNELADHQKKREGRTTAITKEEADLEALRLKQLDQEKILNGLREELNEAVSKIHQRESDIRVSKERISSLSERIVRYQEEIESLKKRQGELRNHLEIAQTERESLQVKITSNGRIFTNKKKELDVFQQGLNLKRLDFNSKKQEIITCLEEINMLGSEETRTRARTDNNRGRLARLDDEDKSYQETLKKNQEIQKEKDSAVESIQKERRELVRKRESAQRSLEETEKKIDGLKERLIREQGDLDLNLGRISFLKKVVESREGMPDGAKKLLEEKAAGMLGSLPDLLQTPPEYRKAVEAGLGEAVGYLVMEKADQAYAALKLLNRRGGGQVALICLDRIGKIKPAARAKYQGDGIFGWADELVKASGSLGPVLTYLLGDLLLVKDMETALRIADQSGSVRFATLDGEILAPWGMIQKHAQDTDSMVVGRQQRIQELDKQIRNLRSAIEETGKFLQAAEGDRKRLIEEKNGLDRQLHEQETTVVQAEKERSKVQFESDRAEEGLKNNAAERQKLLEEIEKLGESLEGIRPRMEGLLEKREEIERISALMLSDLERLEGEETAMEEEVHRLNLAVVRLNGEAKNLEFDIEHSQGLVKEVGDTIGQRTDEISKAQALIAKLEEETGSNEDALREDYADKESREARLGKQESSYQTLLEDVRRLEQEVRQVRKDRDANAEQIHNLEMSIAELEHEKKSLKERIQDSFDTNLDAFVPEKTVDLDAAEAEIEDIRRKMKALGVVNMMALEEYDQQKERLDFLIQQRDDLLSAEQTLKETILKINQTARQRFSDVFVQVRENFKKTFSMFFQGGEADLRLMENEDPLEAQIEIIARPAGKHFRDLTLLSGGERALTAISLLFALYLVKPSPFCILDEIDAPLDDANVNRFTRVLKEFAQKTQFIIVTHNKMTMKAAGSLYGVTMEEEGVSKIVSVQFDEKEDAVAERVA